MSFEFTWDDDEHSIIRFDIDGRATWDEYHQAIDLAREKILDSSHRIDIIFNEITGMPQGNPLPHLRVSDNKINNLPMFGAAVVVSAKGTPSKLTRTFIEMAMRVYKLDPNRQGGFYNTLEEAREAIAELRNEEVSNRR